MVEKKWCCVALVTTRAPLKPPPILHVSLVLPTSSPGNKDFHSCACGDPQQGREKREEKGKESFFFLLKRGVQGGTLWPNQAQSFNYIKHLAIEVGGWNKILQMKTSLPSKIKL